MEYEDKKYEDLSMYYKQRKLQICEEMIRELLERNRKHFDSIDANTWILLNNEFICKHLALRCKGNLEKAENTSILNDVQALTKEWLYKDKNKMIEVDLILCNTILQCYIPFFIQSSEEKYSSADTLGYVVIALRKLLSTLTGMEFIPPISIKIDKPSLEIEILAKDIFKILPDFNPRYRILLSSNLLLLLQLVVVLNFGHIFKNSVSSSSQGWALALQNLSVIMPNLIQIIEEQRMNLGNDYTKVLIKQFDPCETHNMDINSDGNMSILEEKSLQTSINEIPIFTCNIIGEPVIYQEYRMAHTMEKDIIYHLLFTTKLIYQLFGHSITKTDVSLFVREEDMLSEPLLYNAWNYIQGFIFYNSGKLKEAMALMEVSDFSSFSPHFRAKKALLNASLLKTESNHFLALTILNGEALDCQDCLPAVLYNISEEHRLLGQNESQLAALRLLFKVLKHRNHWENLRYCQPNMFLMVLEVIHPLPDVTMVQVLEKLASTLAYNELYEESAERYLDLSALLENTGPAMAFLQAIHNAAAALLLISDQDRSKYAAALCKRATEITKHSSDSSINMQSSTSQNSSWDGPTTNKRPKLESNVGEIFLELQEAINSDKEMEKLGDMDSYPEPNDDIEVDIFKFYDRSNLNFREMPHHSIYSTLLSSERDLTSSILLSECAFRENEIQSSILLLNRCLHSLSDLQFLERSKLNARESFLRTIDFIISHIWLRKAKILIKKESTENNEYSSDIEHCFRNAVLRNPDDDEIKYYYLNHMLMSGKAESSIVEDVISKNHVSSETFLNSPPTANLAVWYLFRPTVNKDQYHKLVEQIKKLKSKSE